MAQIGLRDIFIAPITEDSEGIETYGTPVKLAPAMTVDFSMSGNDVVLRGDDHAVITVRDNGNGTITMQTTDLTPKQQEMLLDAKLDANGALISSSADQPKPKAVGFRSLKENGKYRYIWLYRVVFAVPNESFETKGETIAFKTPSIVGTFSPRNKADANGNYPWKSEITEDGTPEKKAIADGWFSSVYEPVFTETQADDDTTPNETTEGGES